MGIFCSDIVLKLRQLHLTKVGNFVMSAAQLLLLALSFIMMEFYTGYYDILQVILFSVLIAISFGFDTAVNSMCSGRLANRLGKFSMVIFISQSLAYMYPIFPYPVTWKKYYLAHFGYVFLVSAVNWCFVNAMRKIVKALHLKKLLFVIKDDKTVENG